MKRFTHKKCRRYGIKLCQNEKCPVTKRNYPPGLHGSKRVRMTEFGMQLAEKQKTKIVYNILEKKFRRYFDKAVKQEGDTGENLLRSLELRLDNVIYRMGLAKTRRQARQLVSHNHFLINGKKINIPSYNTKVGDEISIREKSQKSSFFQENLQNLNPEEISNWLNWDKDGLKGKIIKDPISPDLKKTVNTKMIIEFYSR